MLVEPKEGSMAKPHSEGGVAQRESGRMTEACEIMSSFPWLYFVFKMAVQITQNFYV